MKKIISVILCLVLCLSMSALLGGCGGDDNTILIYSSGEDFLLDLLRTRLKEKFPDYNIDVQYMGTGNIAASILAEGEDTDCDIVYDLEYGYLSQLANKGLLADISEFVDMSVFVDDAVKSNYFTPELRNGGAIIVNTEVLAEKGLAEPTCYADLLKPEYKKLISMPNPSSSGTGYMFLKNLVNVMGEDEAFNYFDALSENIISYTASGSGPVNALLSKEAAIGLGMTSQAVTKITADNAPFKILFFEEGSPYSLYGSCIPATNGDDEAVRQVFSYIVNEFSVEKCEKFFPEKIFKNKDFSVENYPTNIKYGNMSNDTPEEKERLLAKWTH